MAMSPAKLAEVQGLIVQGVEIKVITEKTKVSRASVYNIKNEMEADAKKNQINELGRATPAILSEVAKGIRDRAPLALEGEVEKLLGAAESLQRLETNFHNSFDNVLIKANQMLKSEDLSLIDWQIITNVLAGAFKDIYNSKGTTVNVAQMGGQGGDNSLSMFQSRMKS